MTQTTAINQAQQVIDLLPDQAKRNVLFSLVGSINASIIGTASSLAARLERDGYDLRDLEPRDITHMLHEADERDDLLLATRRLMRVGTVLRDQLAVVSNDDSVSSLSDTLDFMTKPSTRSLDADLVKATLAAAGIIGIDPEHFTKLHAMNGAQRAAKLSAQRGMIEWIIEHVFTQADTHDFEDITDTIEDLHPQQVERLYEKLVAACNRARDNAVLGVLSRDKRYSLGDLSLITAAITAAEELDAQQHWPAALEST